MTFEVETGTGSATANAYCSVEFADAWHSSRGITTWATMSTGERQAAIVRATHYLVFTCRQAWSGIRANEAQALDWPRSAAHAENGWRVYSHTEIPAEVKQACAELALKAAAGELLAEEGPQVLREKIGPIEFQYKEGSARTRFPVIDSILAPLFAVQSAHSFQLSRA